MQELLILGKKIGCKSTCFRLKDMNGDKFLGCKCLKVLYIFGYSNVFAKEQNSHKCGWLFIENIWIT